MDADSTLDPSSPIFLRVQYGCALFFSALPAALLAVLLPPLRPARSIIHGNWIHTCAVERHTRRLAQLAWGCRRSSCGAGGLTMYGNETDVRDCGSGTIFNYRLQLTNYRSTQPALEYSYLTARH